MLGRIIRALRRPEISEAALARADRARAAKLGRQDWIAKRNATTAQLRRELGMS